MLGGFSVGLELRKWGIADVLGFNPKNDPETCHRNFNAPKMGWLPHFRTPRGIIYMGTWRTLLTRRILHAPGAISSFRQASLEFGPQSVVEDFTVCTAAAPEILGR